MLAVLLHKHLLRCRSNQVLVWPFACLSHPQRHCSLKQVIRRCISVHNFSFFSVVAHILQQQQCCPSKKIIYCWPATWPGPLSRSVPSNVVCLLKEREMQMKDDFQNLSDNKANIKICNIVAHWNRLWFYLLPMISNYSVFKLQRQTGGLYYSRGLL